MSTTENTNRSSGKAGQPRSAGARPSAAPAQAAAAPPKKASKPSDASAVGRFRQPGKVMPHHDERVATDMARNAMSRERYEFHLRALYVALAILGVSVCANIYLGLRQPQFIYYALSADGRITPVVPLENPIQSTEQVLSWTTGAVAQAFSFSFANYQQQLNDARYLFTDSGWTGFRDALTRQKTLETVIQQKLVATAVPESAPVIVSSGISAEGRYAWRVEIPILVSFDSASAVNSARYLLDVVVQRVPETDNPRGLAIGQIIAR